jgi:hypothetical protein
MSVPNWMFLLVAISTSATLVACGGSSAISTTPMLPISLSFTSTVPTSLQVNATASLAVTVANDSMHAGVKWSVTCSASGAACGSLSTSGPATSTTYTAPSALPSATNNSVTLTAASVADSTKSVSATIVLGTPSITLAFSPAAAPPNAIQAGASALIAVIVTGDTSNNGVSWSVTCGFIATPCGAFHPSNTASGTPTTFIAPSGIPPGFNVTVKATSVTNPGDSISIPIFVSLEPTRLPNGSYVFQLSGTNANHFYSVSGVFSVTNGSITGGEQDFIDPATGAKHDIITGGSILAIDDGNLWITLKTGDPAVGVNGLETLDATLLSPSQASLIEFDSSASAAGTLDLQTAISPPSAGYAFSLSGRDSARSATALAGAINVDGSGTISGNGSVFDINDPALPGPLAAQTFAASSFSSPDGQGRLQFHLVPSPASGIATIDLIGYIVDAKHIRLVETTDAYGGFTWGTALAQAGPFNISSVNFVCGAIGEDPNGVLTVAGLLVAGPNTGTSGVVTGNVSGTFSWNDHTGVANQTPLPLAAGTYTLDTSGPGAGTGRVSLIGLTDSTTHPTFTYDLALYLTGDGQGLLILMDKDAVLTGQGFQQTQTGFTAAAFAGPYVMNVRHVLVSGTAETRQFGVGFVVADGVGSLSGVFDFNPPTANNLSLMGDFTANTNGVFTGTLAGLDTSQNPSIHNFAYYFVSASQAVLIETDNAQLTLGFLDLQ